LKGDPLGWLQLNGSTPVRYRVHRDLLEDTIQAHALRELLPACPEVQEIFARQLPCGGWFREDYLYHRNGSQYGYGAIQELDKLADCGITTEDSRVRRAVEYFLRFRTADGRFFWSRKEVERGQGEYGSWVAMFYEGCTLRALLCLGVPEDELAANLGRILSLQLADGSWALRYCASGRPLSRKGVTDDSLDRIWGTTLALYALQSSSYCDCAAVRRGASYLLDRLFEPEMSDKPSGVWWYYSLRYPDFYASVLHSLESATQAGFTIADARLDAGVRWLLAKQSGDGLWRTSFATSRLSSGYRHIIKNHDWITFRALGVLKRSVRSVSGDNAATAGTTSTREA